LLVYVKLLHAFPCLISYAMQVAMVRLSGDQQLSHFHNSGSPTYQKQRKFFTGIQRYINSLFYLSLSLTEDAAFA